MRLPNLCIERPVLTIVMSLLIVLVGAIAMPRLPNRELPDVDPPVVSVTTIYPGAAAIVVETSVSQLIEGAVNGVEGMKHVRSESRDEVSTVTIQFELDRDIEAAANDVRDRVARIRNKLPESIDEPVVAKSDSDAQPIVWLALYGEGFDQVELTQVAEEKIQDRLEKVPGVANVFLGGERRFSMRVWLHNRRLGAQQLAISDVVAALKRENVDIPAGRIESTDSELTVRSLGEMQTAEEYARMVVYAEGAKQVRLGDIARVETGPETLRKIVRFNGKPAIGLGVVKQSKANTLSVADGVKAEVEQIRSELEEGLLLDVAFDSSIYISESIRDVALTIFVAALLVVLVIYVFLRSMRSTVVPAVAIPVSVLGTFAVLYFAGYSINTLTLMGLTLAIGLVVDDAIVVLENITRWVEDGTPPFEAARRGMAEIAFAVISATIASVAVFLPLVFLTDTAGRLFRELAVTVASAVAISGFVALTLVPMMCARLLKHSETEHGIKAFFARAIDGVTSLYGRALELLLNRRAFTTGLVALGFCWVGFGVYLYGEIDHELMAQSDRGFFIVFTQAQEGATIDYMSRYHDQAEDLVRTLPELKRNLSVVALGIGTPGVVNQGIIFAQLEEERERSQQEIVKALRKPLGAIAGIKATPLDPSPMSGIGGQPIEITLTGPDLERLAIYADELERRAEATGRFKGFRSNLVLNKPQLEVHVDRERAGDLGMSMEEIATAMQILLGGADISTFKMNGETYNVMLQLDAPERTRPSDLLEIFVRGHSGLVPLAAVVSAKESIAPRSVPHYDRLRSVTLTASLGEGGAQGRGLEEIMQIAQEILPEEGGYRAQFSGEAESFFESGNALVFAYLLSILIVYLVLSAQFESFIHPVTILVAVFLSFTGALVGLKAMGMTLNLFSEIGIVMLVGLVTKNSILIVEFANQLRERGQDLVPATIDAARIRFRPILMTALATVMGIVPIAAGLGAGGESRAPLGVAVIGGMLFSTFLTFFIVPATYISLARLRGSLPAASEKGHKGRGDATDEEALPAVGDV